MLAAAPLAAQDACPTASDLANGITFDLTGTETETYRDAGNGVVEVIYSDGEGFQTRTLLGQGAYLLEIVDLENGTPVPDTRTTYAHIFPPAEMPKPQPEMVWASQVTTTGDGFGQELHDHRGGVLSTITVGTCRYDTFRLTVTYDDADNTIDTLQYLPELGFALLVGVAYNEEDGTRVEDVYSYVDVATAGPSPSASPVEDGSNGRKVRGNE
jgi:hypothetical protein